MKHQIPYLSALLAMGWLFAGCTAVAPESADEFASARAMIRENRAECVVLHAGTIIAAERGRGIRPLLALHDAPESPLKNATVVDKVVGRAAAFIAISGGAGHVHGELMSRSAAELLTARGITISHQRLVPEILNQKQDGLCPLEQAVAGISDPGQAVTALRRKLHELSRRP